MDDTGPDDADLVERAKRGDRDAFAALVRRYYRTAYAAAWGVLGRADEAEEISQAAFVQAWEKLEKLRDAGAVASWIWRIARDTALKYLRKHRRMRPTASPPETGAETSPPEGELVRGEERQAVLGAMERLPEDMRDALRMRFWEELDYAAMAQRTGASETALYQRVCRGLKKLRDFLGEGA